MFPTLVWRFQLAPAWQERVEEKLLPALSEARGDLPALRPGLGWQSETTLHRREELQDLVGCVANAAKGILRFLHVGHDELEVTGCWATILAPGATHRAHTHPNNFLSGVYYVRTHPGADVINFHEPRTQANVIRPPVTELTAENTDQVVVKVTDGTLLMFPSWLEHSVDANATEEERISISFNLMFSSFAETVGKPLW